MTSDVEIETTPLRPFGLLVTSTKSSAEFSAIPATQIRGWIDEHRVLVARGFRPPADDQLLLCCQQLGRLMKWDFGYINELKVRADAQNYLYTNREVPFHWDGAFAGVVPHYIFFHCRLAPPIEAGGETLFCDTTRLLRQVADTELEAWRRVSVTYSTEKLAHYGGSFSSPIVAPHPVSGASVVRFAEPVADSNPIHLKFEGLAPQGRDPLLTRMRELLRDETTCYAHSWRDDDIVIADNHMLLHGRNAFTQHAARHLRRINILD